MKKQKERRRGFWLVGVVLGALLTISLACGADATPVPASAPTAQPAPTAVPVPTAAPVATSVLPPAPTRVVQTGPTYGGNLRLARNVDPYTLDPTFSYEYNSLIAMYSIFNNLVILNESAEVVPDLAESWDFSADGTQITFKMHTGVKFTDGTPVNAQAVKFTYDRYQDKDAKGGGAGANRRASQLSLLKSVAVVDDSTIRFTLAEPFRPFLAIISERAGMILSPTALRKDAFKFESKPVGSGPYMITRWMPDSTMVMEKNPNYWNPKEQYLDRIQIYQAIDPAVMFAMARTGEADIVESIRVQDLSIAKSNPKLKIAENFGARYEVIIMRIDSSAPFNNRNFRRALAFATDRETLIATHWDGHAEPAYTPTGPAYGVWHNPDLKPIEYNLATAKEELALAGYPNGITFTLPCASTTKAIQHCEILQTIWANAGINVDISPRIASGFWSKFATGANDIIVSWRGGRPDPHVNIQRTYHTKGFSNYLGYRGGPNNAEVDRLIDAAGKEYDVAKAKALYDKALEIIGNDVIEIYQVHPIDFYVLANNVHGYAFHMDGVMRLRDMWLE